MQRNHFLSVLLGASAAVLACAGNAVSQSPPAPPPRTRRPIRGLCFDLFTLFDPRSVVPIAQSIVGARAPEFCETWRTRQFQYSWLRASADQYRDFHAVTHEALDYATRTHGVALSDAQRKTLVGAYSRLEPWPDTRSALQEFRSASLRLAPLANYAPPMIATLLDNAGLTEFFDAQVSTDAARTYKPDPRAYALGIEALQLEREEIAFAAFGGWDAAGARWFGYPTFWVNRLGVEEEALEPGADGTGRGLVEFGEFVSAWR